MFRYQAMFLLIFAVFAGVYWHFSDAPPRAVAAGGTEKCRHKLDNSDCPFCTPALIEKMGMCVGHDVPEALCWICNSLLVEAYRVENDWCAGHNRPESRCAICNPSVVGSANQRSTAASAARGIGAGAAIMDTSIPRSQRPPSTLCGSGGMEVRLASIEIARRAGLSFVQVQRRPITQAVRCNAEIAYDGNRFAHLSSRVPGVVKEVRADLGDLVRAGEVLAVIDSPELAASKAEYRLALAAISFVQRNFERESSLLGQGVSTDLRVFEEQTKLTEARIAEARAIQALRALGLTEDEIAAVAREEDSSSQLPLAAPFDGVIVDRSAVVGEAVDRARMLFSVADTRRMWAYLDTAELGAPLRAGQIVVMTVDGLPGRTFQGGLTWVSSMIDDRTRTLRARAEFDNTDGGLRANMFGQGHVVVRDQEPLLVIPKGVVQWDGCCNIVFTRESETIFRAQPVQLAPAGELFFEVHDGLAEGQVVVLDGSFLLKTEILRGEIGAGCCEIEHR